MSKGTVRLEFKEVTDSYIEQINALSDEKEKEIMEI